MVKFADDAFAFSLKLTAKEVNETRLSQPLSVTTPPRAGSEMLSLPVST